MLTVVEVAIEVKALVVRLQIFVLVHQLRIQHAVPRIDAG
jgi:hypothetical protein